MGDKQTNKQRNQETKSCITVRFFQTTLFIHSRVNTNCFVIESDRGGFRMLPHRGMFPVYKVLQVDSSRRPPGLLLVYPLRTTGKAIQLKLQHMLFFFFWLCWLYNAWQSMCTCRLNVYKISMGAMDIFHPRYMKWNIISSPELLQWIKYLTNPPPCNFA